MAENLDLNNLYLDDNSFITIPEGDYHFKVQDYEMEYSTSDKLPENTQVIVLHFDIPAMVDGTVEHVSIRHRLNVYSKALFAIRQFFESVGLMPEKGRAKMPNPELAVGKEGVCHIIQGVSAKGNEYNQIDICYPPSKAPLKCANDDVWKKEDASSGFKPGDEAEVNPFV
jgi:hypothetical protein